jgi:hypothetical protein
MVLALAGCGATVTNVVKAAAMVAANAKDRRILIMARLPELVFPDESPDGKTISESHARRQESAVFGRSAKFRSLTGVLGASYTGLFYVRIRTRTVRSRTR